MKRKKKIDLKILLSLFAVVLAVLGCQKSSRASVEEQKPQIVRVGTVVAQRSTFIEVGIYYGKLTGIESATLVSQLGGRVDSVDAVEGNSVTIHKSLGRVNVEKAESNLQIAILNEKMNRENFERQKQFLADGNASQVGVDQSQLAWLTAKNTLLDAQRALEGARCVAPFAGIVTRRFVEPFQELAPGSPTFSISNVARMKVSIGIPEPEIAGVGIGNPAEVTASSLPGKTWKGTLSRLNREISAQTLTFDAEVTIDNPGRELLPGMTATVTLQRRRLTDQILVPTEALLTSGQETFLMIERAGVARKAPVTVGSTTRTQTVILKGLEPGQNVIVQGNNLTADGASVVVTERS